MTIEQSDTIDLISVDPNTNSVILTISDHLDWTAVGEHLLLLQDKLNRYLAFIESGELLASYPPANGRSIVISLIYKYPPDRNASEFFERITPIIRDAGFEFTHRRLKSD